MMTTEQEVGMSFHRSIHRKGSMVERLKTAMRMAAVGTLISVTYVVCIALLLSPAYHLA